MSSFYKLIITYNGFEYYGWQIQNGSSLPTIQSTINESVSKIFNNPEVKTIASGRTDAKVHAFNQVVRLEVPKEMEAENLRKALNSLLPENIRVKKLSPCHSDFHPIRGATSKEYHYYFTYQEKESAFQDRFIGHCRARDLDFDLMNQACDLLIGKHDFCNYFCQGTPVKSTIREIFECSLSEGDLFHSSFIGESYVIKVKGSGFLKQMVRLIVGALWEVGKGRLTLDKFEKSLRAQFDSHLAPVAPPQGLYLHSVNY